MKKLFFAITACLFVTSVFAQEVIVEENPDSTKNVILLGGNETPDEDIDKTTCVNSSGSNVRFPKGGLTGLYNPVLAWNISECKTSDGLSVTRESLILITIGSTDYHSFDEESRILIRFTDGSMSTLHRDITERVSKDYSSSWIGSTLMKYYYTGISLKLDTETREKLLNPTLGIVKIRIVFTNGDIRDYDISGNRVSAIPQELRTSYLEAQQKNKKRISNSDDSTF